MFSTSHRLIRQPGCSSGVQCFSLAKIAGAQPCHWSILSNSQVALAEVAVGEPAQHQLARRRMGLVREEKPVRDRMD